MAELKFEGSEGGGLYLSAIIYTEEGGLIGYQLDSPYLYGGQWTQYTLSGNYEHYDSDGNRMAAIPGGVEVHIPPQVLILGNENAFEVPSYVSWDEGLGHRADEIVLSVESWSLGDREAAWSWLQSQNLEFA